ncbi:MAG: HAMP domain-containing sensor histidine kinase [Bdellovibrionota bacterium]
MGCKARWSFLSHSGARLSPMPLDRESRNLLRVQAVMIVFVATVLVGSRAGHDWAGPVKYSLFLGLGLLAVLLLGLLNVFLEYRLFPRFIYQYFFSIFFSIGCTAVIQAAGSTTTPSAVLYVPCIVFSTLLWGVPVGVTAAAVSLGGYFVVWMGDFLGYFPYAPLYPEKAPLAHDLHIAIVALLWVVAFCIFSVLFSAYFRGVFRKEAEARERAILELQMANNELARTRRELAHKEAMAATGTLAAGAAHELGNPLGASYSLLQALFSEAGGAMEENGKIELDREDVLATLGRALEEQRRARSIVSELLELTGEKDQGTTTFDLNELIRSQARRVAGEKSYSGKLDFDLAESLPAVRGNERQIGKAIAAIVQNAVEAVGQREGGRIALRSEAAPDGKVRFSCEDNGPGIPENLRQEIFRPFFTTRRDKKAIGLGLYAVHRAAERHGGKCWAEGGSIGGARVCMEFAASSPARAEELSKKGG